MSEMIDRIATVIAASDDVCAIAAVLRKVPCRPDCDCLIAARNVISALREPTAEMVDAVERAEQAYDVHEPIPWMLAWRAAIEAALKD